MDSFTRYSKIILMTSMFANDQVKIVETLLILQRVPYELNTLPVV
jgi:hypothetical protein